MYSKGIFKDNSIGIRAQNVLEMVENEIVDNHGELRLLTVK
jgi:hypothetical protein